MAHLYHITCHNSRWQRFCRWFHNRRDPMPRLNYVTGPNEHGKVSRVEADRITCTQTFRCENCGTEIHIDTDWMDVAGGFIGRQVEPYCMVDGKVRRKVEE